MSAGEPGCEQCDGPLDHQAVVISGGAYRVVDRGARPDVYKDFDETFGASDRPVFEMFGETEAVGFLELVCNDESAPASVGIVDHDSPNGQYDLQFCNTTCLRAFFSVQVDELDAQLARRRNRTA